MLVIFLFFPIAFCQLASANGVDHRYGEGAGVPEQISESLIEIDVSGKHGKSSIRGKDQDGNGRAGRARTGRAGGNSPQPEAGTNSGNVNLNFDVTDGQITVFGYAINPRGRKNPLQFVLDYGARIRAVIRGGNGGSGNRGGNGQQGGKGHDGSDATRYSSATSGGRGGRGGAAGCGSHGADAGDGGVCQISVPEEALELLLLVDTRSEPALGGTKGCHGIPGEGGPGGDGGSGCSWTETESYTTTESDGKGGTRTVSKTRTVVKSRPPAPDGPRGYTGNTPSIVLRDGDDGAPGKIIYNIRRSDGTVSESDSRFLLKLQWFEIIDEHEDGIFEPGDLVKVKNLTVANVGGVELPQNARVFVSIGDSRYTLTEQVELHIPNGLMPGDSLTFDEELKFRIKKGLMPDAAPEAFVVEDSILPRAFVTSQFVDAELEEFRSAIPIAIQYPVKIESVTRLNNLALGEATKFSFKVTNLSTERGFGSDAALERAIRVWIQREGGDLGKDQLEFYAPNGAPINIKDQMAEAISLLGPGESAILEGIVGMRPDADLYRSGVIGVGLELDTNEKKQHHIQHIPLNFSASAAYHSAIDSEAKYILIANQELRQDTFQAWNTLINSLGSELAIWDISYYSFLDLLAKISEDGQGDKTSLAEDFKGKTIILPDHIFEYTEGKSVRATDFLKQVDLLKAQEMYGINFLVISDRGKTKSLFEELRFSAPAKFERHFKGQEELTNNLAQLTPSDIENSNYTQTVVRTLTTKRYFWGDAVEKNLIRRAEKLSWQLAKLDPEGEYTVVHRFRPKRIHRLGRLFGVSWFPKYSLGSLEIRKRASKPYGLGVHMEDEEFNINSVPFIYSQRLLTGLMMATPIGRRLNLLEDIINENPNFTGKDSERMRFDAIVDSIQFSIINEAEQALIQSWKGEPDMNRLKNQLPTLDALVAARIRLSSEMDAHIVDRFIKLAAQLKAIAEQNIPWYDRVLPGRTMEQKVRSVYSEKLGEFLQTSFGMKRQAWSWFGRIFDSKTERQSGFSDQEINNQVGDLVNGWLSKWKNETHGEVVNDIVPGEFQTPVADSKPVVLNGAEADQLDAQARTRELEVVGDVRSMVNNRESLSVPNPGVRARLEGAGSPAVPGSCVRLLKK